LTKQKRGLKKAKKVMTHGKGKSRFEMQDTHKCVVPFGGEEGSGLFLVFDGHAGKVRNRGKRLSFLEWCCNSQILSQVDRNQKEKESPCSNIIFRLVQLCVSLCFLLRWKDKDWEKDLVRSSSLTRLQKRTRDCKSELFDG